MTTSLVTRVLVISFFANLCPFSVFAQSEPLLVQDERVLQLNDPNFDAETFSRMFTEEQLSEPAELNVLIPEPNAAVPVIEKVVTSSLSLLGRGVKPRGGSESLALACYPAGSSECAKVRFVWFKQAGQAYFIGDVMTMPKTQDPNLKKESLRLVIQKFFTHHETLASDSKKNRFIFRAFLTIVTATCIVALHVPMTATGSLVNPYDALKIMGVMIGGFIFMSNVKIQKIFVSGGLIEARFTHNQSWNWLEHPRKMSKKSFRMILGQIIKGTNLNLFSSEDERIDRKVRKYRDRGVEFGDEMMHF